MHSKHLLNLHFSVFFILLVVPYFFGIYFYCQLIYFLRVFAANVLHTRAPCKRYSSLQLKDFRPEHKILSNYFYRALTHIKIQNIHCMSHLTRDSLIYLIHFNKKFFTNMLHLRQRVFNNKSHFNRNFFSKMSHLN